MRDLPRVTTILKQTESAEKQKALIRWRKKIESLHGVEEAKIIQQKVLDNGTKFHLSVECFLKGIEETDPHPWIGRIKSLLNSIKQTSSFLQIEERLFCYEHGFQGKPDLICEFEDQVTIIDWTTSQNIKRKQWVSHKFLQAGAYSLAASQEVKQLAVVVVTEQNYQIFTDPPSQWQSDFLDRLNQYKALSPSILQS